MPEDQKPLFEYRFRGVLESESGATLEVRVSNVFASYDNGATQESRLRLMHHAMQQLVPSDFDV